jgi:hypothetical protein
MMVLGATALHRSSLHRSSQPVQSTLRLPVLPPQEACNAYVLPCKHHVLPLANTLYTPDMMYYTYIPTKCSKLSGPRMHMLVRVCMHMRFNHSAAMSMSLCRHKSRGFAGCVCGCCALHPAARLCQLPPLPQLLTVLSAQQAAEIQLWSAVLPTPCGLKGWLQGSSAPLADLSEPDTVPVTTSHMLSSNLGDPWYTSWQG